MQYLGSYYSTPIITSLLTRISFSIFAVPYVIPMIKNIKQVYKVLYAIPFSIIYFPALTFLAIPGFIKGITYYYRFKEGERAW